MKHIAFFISSLHKGGAERVFVNLAEYFYKSGYEVTIVTQYIGENEYSYSEGIHREISDITEDEITGNRITNFVKRFQKLRGIWKKVNPDIILSCIGKNNFMAVATTLFLSPKVVVSVVGEPMEEYYTKAMRFLAKTLFYCADGIVLQTTDSKHFFPKALQKKAVILQNSVNPIFIKEIYEGSREKRIVSVGRLDDNKNHAMIIQAFQKIHEHYPDYTLTIYGEGESRQKLEALITKLQLEQYVFLPGITTDVVNAIERTSMFILSSYTEGMPNALIEAMCLGMPVISTDCPCGGPKELICTGENGILIPVNDVKALEDAMEQILSDAAFSKKLGRNAAKIRDRVDPKVTNECWKHYFEQVMQEAVQ